MDINHIILAIFTWISYLTICLSSILIIIEFIDKRREHVKLLRIALQNRKNIEQVQKEVHELSSEDPK